MLTKDGVFVSIDVKSPQGSMDSDRDQGVRPMLREGEHGDLYSVWVKYLFLSLQNLKI